MKTVAIIQARLGSVRLPRKVMRPIGGTPAIGVLFKRLSRARLVDQLVLATSDLPENDPLEDYVRQLGFEVFRGSEKDVLDRYYRCAVKFGADVVIRITGDCPLIDPAVVDGIVQRLHETGADYASNAEPPTFPNGVDAEVFTFKSLETAWNETSTSYEREHVTPYLLGSSRFHRVNYAYHSDYSQERWTVDEPEDLEVVQRVFEYFAPDIYFGWEAVIRLKEKEPEIFAANRHVPMNEGASMTTDQKFSRRASHILGSTQPEWPRNWPVYLEKAKGCAVWDLEHRKFTDFSSMDFNLLGYAHDEVDSAVTAAIAAGKGSIDGPEGVYLAEKLLDLHPWANRALMEPGGYIAVSRAIDLARRETGRKVVALFSDIAEPQTNDGTPTYDVVCRTHSDLKQALDSNEVAAILVRLARPILPGDNSLTELRRLSQASGIVLIFDERWTAFRQHLGGSHLASGISPDLAIFGESISNGYPVGVVLGARDILTNAAPDGSRGGTVGAIAALKTLEIIEREKVCGTLTQIGESILQSWSKLASKHRLHFENVHCPSLCALEGEEKPAVFWEEITQGMLERGYLVKRRLTVSTAHTPEVITGFMETLDSVLSVTPSS